MDIDSTRGAVPKIFSLSLFIIAFALLVLLGGLWFVAELQRWTFSRPHRIQPGANPNHFYSVEVQSVHLGAVGQDFVARVQVRLKNSSAVPVNLDARAVRLADSKENQFSPTFPPGVNPLLVILPQKTENLWLEFSLPAGALDGGLFLMFTPRHRVRIKDSAPFKAQLRSGEFRVLQKLSW